MSGDRYKITNQEAPCYPHKTSIQTTQYTGVLKMMLRIGALSTKLCTPLCKQHQKRTTLDGSRPFNFSPEKHKVSVKQKGAPLSTFLKTCKEILKPSQPK